MRVLLKGIGGVYNYGCEAIVRGTVNMLRMIDPAIQIDYASFRMDDDRRRLKGCDVNIIPAYKKWSVRNILKAVLNRLHIKNSIPLENYNEITKYNAVISIGGDIYTIYPGGLYAESLVRYGEECYRRGVPYILWGCSVGPFEGYPSIKKIFTKHLLHTSLILAREQVTIDYLKQLGISSNICFSMDPAYFVSPISVSKKVTKFSRIGINLSPASLLFHHLEEKKYISIQACAIQSIIDTFDCDITLLPHVVDTLEIDNDYTYLRKVYDALPLNVKRRVLMVDNDPGFIGIKKEILRCDLTISARMHCCINSLTCGIPTIFLSYSEKSKGMCKLIYGTDQNCIPIEDFAPDKIVDKIRYSNFDYSLNGIEINDNVRNRIKELLKSEK